MGFTRERDLHLLTRRLRAWRDEFGAEASGGGGLLREAVVRGGPIEDGWSADVR